MRPGEDDYWPKGEAYESPPETKPLHPRCSVCGARHVGRVPWCSQDNEGEQDDA